MTTHQLASLLEHLHLGFGDSLKAGTGFVEAIAALREAPDQSLKELAKKLQAANSPRSAGGRSASVDLEAIIKQIQSIREDVAQTSELPDPSRLTSPQLKQVLRSFQQPTTGTKPTLVGRVRQLYAPTSPANNGLSSSGATVSANEMRAVDEGIRLFCELRDNKSLSISDVRARFEPFRGYSKPVVEEVSRRLKYTPHGSRTEMLERLLSNLESIKVSQYKMDQILTGT
jgi:hypothetical protein